MTVIIDSADTARAIENVLNECKRHCRIGKVTKKDAATVPLRSPLDNIFDMQRYTQPTNPTFLFNRPVHPVCAGCKGACGNAACPSRMVSTC